jgi:hypothetical protein
MRVFFFKKNYFEAEGQLIQCQMIKKKTSPHREEAEALVRKTPPRTEENQKTDNYHGQPSEPTKPRTPIQINRGWCIFEKQSNLVNECSAN